MDDRVAARIGHVKEAIGLSRQLLEGRAPEDVRGDRFARAAFERFLEIVSEASRHIREAWKAEHPEIPWRSIRDLGNVIRHAYDGIDFAILWGIYEADLAPLEAVLDEMLVAYSRKGQP